MTSFANGDLASKYEQALKKAADSWNAQNLKDYIGASKELEGLAEGTNDTRLKGEAYFHVGRAAAILKQYSKSAKYLERSHKLAEQLGDKGLEAGSLYVLGYIANKQDKVTEAMRHFKEAEKKAQAAGDKKQQAWTLLNFGEVYWMKLNDYSKAYECFAHALELCRQINDGRGIGASYRNIGEIFALRGEVDKAIDFFKKAGNGAGLSKTIQEAIFASLGSAYAQKEDYKAALDFYNQALALMQKDEAKTDLNVLLGLMGETYLRMGAFDEAEPYLKRALTLSKQSGRRQNEAFCLKDFADLYVKRNKLKQAEKFYQAALKMADELRYEDIGWQTYQGLGQLSEARGQTHQALEYYRKAAELIQRVTKRLTVKERSGFLENKLDLYEKIVDLLLRMAQDEVPIAKDSKFAVLAFHYAEKARAQAFLAMMQQGRLLENLRLEASLRERLADNQSQLRKTYAQMAAHSEQIALSQRQADLQIQSDALEKQQAEIIRQICQKYPNFARVYEMEVLSLEEVQSQLRNKEILLQYLVGQQKTVVFIVGKDQFAYIELPIGRKALKERIKALGGLFSHLDDFSGGVKDLADIQLDKANDLYRLIFRPVENYLKAGDELIIVPDDVLSFIPFEMLVTELGGPHSHYRSTYLIERYAMSYEYSASLLNEKLSKSRTKAQAEVLAFGNPDLSALKPNMGSFEPDVFPSDELIEKAKQVESRRAGFKPLPYAELEVDQISQLVRRSKVFKKDQATEQRFKQWASRAKLIHLATHNVVDALNPLYSKILLAAEGTQQGEDGLLHTYEIFDLDLEADLVVLSGCETGLGRLRRGEGLEGMSRAFRYAGAAALVATLWKVADYKPTAELMRKFYTYLTEGMDKRKALRKAKLEILRGDGENPFYWAPFILIGDTKPVSIEKPPFWMVFLRIEPMPAVQVVLLGMASWLFLYAIRSFYKQLRKSRSRPIRSASERLSHPS